MLFNLRFGQTGQAFIGVGRVAGLTVRVATLDAVSRRVIVVLAARAAAPVSANVAV